MIGTGGENEWKYLRWKADLLCFCLQVACCRPCVLPTVPTKLGRSQRTTGVGPPGPESLHTPPSEPTGPPRAPWVPGRSAQKYQYCQWNYEGCPSQIVKTCSHCLTKLVLTVWRGSHVEPQIVVNCPTRWSLFFIFVFLCWSTNKYQKYKSVELGDQLHR